MPEYLAPGVYVEEISTAAKPIEAVPTSIAVFLGKAERGPAGPARINSWSEYRRRFGGFFGSGEFLPYSVQGFFANGGKCCYVTRIVATGTATVASHALDGIHIRAVGAGSWGRRIVVKIERYTDACFTLIAHYWSELPEPLFDPDADANSGRTPQPDVSERFEGLVLDQSSADYFVTRINQTSCLIEVAKTVEAVSLPARCWPICLDQGGDDGEEPDVNDYTGAGSETGEVSSGLSALNGNDYAAVSLVYVPDAFAVQGLPEALVKHCEGNRYRFAILDAPAAHADVTTLDPRSQCPSSYAAFYYPWIRVPDGIDAATQRLVPPGGHVAGIYARTDSERGVHKTPANEAIKGAVGLEYDINKRQQDLLNPRGVNVIRHFAGRGIRVWGARTLANDALWQYVNVRRLLIFLEASIERGLQWVVFEPNGEGLWARVRQAVADFLLTQWRAGALQGNTPEQAFFVNVGRDTMTQTDIDQGRLILEVGIAVSKPAEFVVFRVGQMTLAAAAGGVS